jgi:two-component system, NarL family, nitrate/nitrite sensor histidine kinase NarX
VLVFSGYFWIAIILLAVILAAIIFYTLHRANLRIREATQGNELIQVEQKRLFELEDRLETVLQLNKDLAEARDESTLIRAALSSVNRLVDGLGSTFVPFDAWGQPLPAFTYGEMPEPVKKGWAEYIVSEHVRNTCANCQELHAGAGHTCPLQIGPLGGTMNIYCLPLALGERRMGMVNVYLPASRVLSDDLHQFLTGLLNEMAFAVEAQRLHAQEVTTLRQLHRLRTPRAGLTSTLESLLESVYTPLGLEVLYLRIRPMSNERLSDLEIVCGDAAMELFAHLKDRWPDLIGGDLDCVNCYAEGYTWLALPLSLPDGQALGVLMAVRKSDESFAVSQKAVLETAAAQAALMIENERLTMSLEYTLVTQERTRLAREIHDGLAQMLAYLKLQASQMQTALTQGDQQRLARLLHESRQAIAEAYNETRLVIDNLRVNSDEGLLSWLLQAAVDFEKTTHVHVVITLPEIAPGWLPEIQAQMIRIVQEGLNNVRKHAQAREVRISLRQLDSTEPMHGSNDWILEIIDDGCGFDPDDVPVVARYGLRGMRERAELIGAEFQITSQPARGTMVRLFLRAQVEKVGE